MKQEELIEELISRVRYANISNFQPWVKHPNPHKRAKLIDGAMQYPTRLVHGLRNKKLINKVEILDGDSIKYNKIFYKPADKSIPPMSAIKMKHQSAMRDIMLSFIYCFPYYYVEITETPVLSKEVDGEWFPYQPDAFIKMTHVNTKKEYNFVIELERTRSHKEIDREKFKKMHKYGAFLGLPKDTKWLFVYTQHEYDVYLRPMQFGDPITETKINSVHTSVRTLWDYMKHYDNPNWYLAALPSVFTINENVCLNCKGEWVKLIN